MSAKMKPFRSSATRILIRLQREKLNQLLTNSIHTKKLKTKQDLI